MITCLGFYHCRCLGVYFAFGTLFLHLWIIDVNDANYGKLQLGNDVDIDNGIYVGTHMR